MSEPLLVIAKRIAVALERIADALESANENDPMRVLAQALTEEGESTADVVPSDEQELSPAEFVALMR